MPILGPRSRTGASRIGAALFFALAVAGATDACRAPTQLTLVITSPVVPCGALKGILISVAGSREEAEKRAGGDYVTASVTCTDPASREVGTLVVTPGATGRAAVIVVAGIASDARTCKLENKYMGCVVSRRSIAFLDHVSGTVPIAIEPECVDVPCDVATTCKRGSCIPSDVDCTEDGSCVTRDPRGRDDAGPGGDEGGLDGSTDGALPDGGPVPDGPTDAPFDTTGSDAMAGECKATCDEGATGGLMTACPAGQFCCHAHGNVMKATPPRNICLPKGMELSCVTGMVGREPGVAACCAKGDDCPGDQECCLTYVATPMPPNERGNAICTEKGMCFAQGGLVLCRLAGAAQPECGGMQCNPVASSLKDLNRCP